MAIEQVIARHAVLKRRAVVPAYRLVARGNVFYPPPRVFANSFPKAGTHLLAAVLRQLPRMMFSGLHRSRGDVETAGWNALARDLRTVRDGQYATGHFPYEAALEHLLRTDGFATLLCLRDPRDIAVSAVNYVMRQPEHEQHRRYRDGLASWDERLMATILGFPADELGPGRGPLADRLAGYVPWLSTEGVCVVRFEDLVGARGGGDDALQRETVARISSHVGRPLDDAALERVRLRVWSSSSSTFHAGRIGGWRERFSEDHVAAFEETCGPVLDLLGYGSRHPAKDERVDA